MIRLSLATVGMMKIRVFRWSHADSVDISSCGQSGGFRNERKRSNYICNELFTWADVYDTASHDERRAILQQFIKEIRVRKDYEISITLNASFDQVEQLKAVSTYDSAEIFEEFPKRGHKTDAFARNTLQNAKKEA